MADVAATHREMLEAVNQRDLVRYRDLLHVDYTYRGPDAGLAQVEPFLQAFPDLHLAAEHQTVSGDISVIEVIASGTQDGDLPGVPATSLLQQLGVMPVDELDAHRRR